MTKKQTATAIKKLQRLKSISRFAVGDIVQDENVPESRGTVVSKSETQIKVEFWRYTRNGPVVYKNGQMSLLRLSKIDSPKTLKTGREGDGKHSAHFVSKRFVLEIVSDCPHCNHRNHSTVLASDDWTHAKCENCTRYFKLILDYGNGHLIYDE